ncbi:Trafficking protein particle complex subunit 11 [Tyrophagus putrescentiae]|nr:Trafficking protein particle complex subunit 11 [Tyrophagus putrescentiae]
MNELPKETAFQPAPYIALVGLDAANNAAHTAIWNAFAINRAVDRPQLYYKLLPADYVFPVAKAKKSYERYIPSGIIKTGWLAKHLFEIPSVAVVFEEVPSLEALAAQASDVRLRCIERVNHVRNSLAGRQTRIVLIILLQQANMVAPLMDDSAQKEIIARLCTDCDLHVKSLYTISTAEVHLIPGLVQRMEQVILELAKGYYLAQAKSVKAHKDQLNKSSQLYLSIRHEFKLAFFNEIRLINNTALGHYKNAYASLMEIRPSPLNLFEVKSIASLLNYKICRLAFYLNIPMDAISHFRKHIEIFQNRPPPPSVAASIEFEHHGWLSDQFLVFAELFELAISTFSLAPSSSQHPGVYFFDASTHMLERRRAAAQVINREEMLRGVSGEEAAILGAIVNCEAREFIGQFSFRHDLPEADRIKLAYRALQYRELSVDHTALLISLYVNVLNQIRNTTAQGRHEDALTYFNNILPFYREERWPTIYFEIVQLALASAYHQADLPTFVRLAFEQMAGDAKIAEKAEERADLMATALELLSHRWRKPLSRSLSSDHHPQLEAKWAEVLAQRSSPTAPPLPDISIPMERVAVDFLSAKVAFSAPSYYIGGRVTVAVALFSSLPLDLERRFSLQLRFSSPYYDQFAMLSEETAISGLRANSLSLADSEQERRQQNISFHWSLAGRSVMDELRDEDDHLQALCGGLNPSRAPFAKFQPLLRTTILEHSSKLTVEAVPGPPAIVYLDEHFPLSFRLTSGEDFPLSKLKLSVKLLTTTSSEEQQAGAAVALEPFYFNVFSLEDHGKLLTPVDPEKRLVSLVEELPPGGTALSTIVLKVVAGAESKLGPGGGCTLSCTFSYDLLLEGEKRRNQVQFVAAQKTLLLPLTALAPFSLRFNVANLGSGEEGVPAKETPTVGTIRVAEPFRLSIEVGQTPTKAPKTPGGDDQQQKEEEEDEIEVASLTPLLAPSTSFVGSKAAETASKFPLSLSKTPLKQTYELVAGTESPVATSLGACTVQWRRRKSKAKTPKAVEDQNITTCEYLLPANESTFSLPATVVSASIVFVELLLPPTTGGSAAVHSRAAFTALYRIHNRLDVDLTAEVSMGTSDCFMVSGNKLIKVCIGAKLFIEQTYIFLPLLCGQLALPQLGVTVHLPGAQAPVTLDHISQMMAPSIKVLVSVW